MPCDYSARTSALQLSCEKTAAWIRQERDGRLSFNRLVRAGRVILTSERRTDKRRRKVLC